MMNKVFDPDVDTERERSLQTVGQISYLLHAVVALGAVLPGAQPGAFLLLIAFAIDLAKRRDAHGSWQASHFRWRIRTVLWAGGLYLVTSPLFLLVIPGWVAWCLISIWFLYRIVRGWLAMSDGRAMPE